MKPEDIQAIFGMQPEAAVEYLKQKHIDVSWDWQDMLDDAHVSAFTVAKTAGMDVAHDIYQAVRNAAETGQAFRDFQRELTPILQAKGWWGRQQVPNPDTGEIQNVQLGSPYRLKTIYLTNLQSAYMAGRYAEMTAAKDTHPYWQYVAVNDSRTRESHRKLHGRVYAADDPVWDTLYPPLDYRCRCRVRPLSRSQGEDKVLPSPKLETITVDIGANKSTGEQRYAQRTGIRLPDGTFVAPNAGFNANQGKTFLQRTAGTAIQKAQSMPPELAKTAVREMMTHEKFRNALSLAELAWVAELLGLQ
ncbi:phage minor head protein [Kingella denitrificans]|uniref:phage head morphogenesis protein n=1 Tax=Kingella denitrificans TaxID=502 RepID=UPI00288AD13C|nr:phage minor head protein [Kingella denitrificans]